MSLHAIYRKPLLRVDLVSRRVTNVEVKEITLEPGQMTGRHLHPCPVLGHILKGSAVLQIEGQVPQIFSQGSAFFEPANTIIAAAGNASSSEPMTFVAYYLRDGEQELIQMLPKEAE